MTTTAPVTAETLAGFLAGVNLLIAKRGYVATATIKKGTKFTRIVEKMPQHEGGAVYCFIENATGNILKSAGWNAPAKTARGNINTPTFGVEFVNEYGAQYLR